MSSPPRVGVDRGWEWTVIPQGRAKRAPVGFYSALRRPWGHDVREVDLLAALVRDDGWWDEAALVRDDRV